MSIRELTKDAGLKISATLLAFSLAGCTIVKDELEKQKLFNSKDVKKVKDYLNKYPGIKEDGVINVSSDHQIRFTKDYKTDEIEEVIFADFELNK